ncbi:hypothetical protein DRJ25_01300 [Candidatus Woesearchaeota archaeon]|nr:MAG: hypothetical protein DRJ25_01300 [Candidatus Woesearchaeota archaeon]
MRKVYVMKYDYLNYLKIMVFSYHMIDNVVFIGTSHISPESIRDVKRIIASKKPVVVAIELDRKRLSALLSKKKRKLSLADIGRIGLKGWLFALFGQWIQKKLGKKLGVLPGSEMLAAYKAAKQNGCHVALVDQDIEKTLRNFSRRLSWKERWHFLVDAIKGLVFKKGVKFDLRKIPEDALIERLISELKVRYPNIYKVLIEDRNKVIARNLCRIIVRFPDQVIVVVLGAGHVREVKELVKKYLKDYDFIH